MKQFIIAARSIDPRVLKKATQKQRSDTRNTVTVRSKIWQFKQKAHHKEGKHRLHDQNREASSVVKSTIWRPSFKGILQDPKVVHTGKQRHINWILAKKQTQPNLLLLSTPSPRERESASDSLLRRTTQTPARWPATLGLRRHRRQISEHLFIKKLNTFSHILFHAKHRSGLGFSWNTTKSSRSTNFQTVVFSQTKLTQTNIQMKTGPNRSRREWNHYLCCIGGQKH